MPWEVLILPLLAFAVWLISNLFRIADENSKKPGTVRRRPESSEPVTEMDRFMQDARQRRRAGQPRRQTPVRLQEQEEVAIPVQEPVMNRRRLTDVDPTGRPVVVMELAPEDRPVPTARPVEPPPPPPPPPRPVVPGIAKAVPVPAPPPRPAEPVETSAQAAQRLAILVPTNARQPSPVLIEVMRMLRSPRTAGAAIILREILDRPPSTRRRYHSS